MTSHGGAGTPSGLHDMVTLLGWLGASPDEVRRARAAEDSLFAALERVSSYFKSQVVFHSGDGDCYVQPYVVPSVPGGMSPAEFAAQVDAIASSPSVTRMGVFSPSVAGPLSPLSSGGPEASQVGLPLGAGVTSRSVFEEADDFLSSADEQTLVVFGEAGMGKTVFTWLYAQRCQRAYDAAVGRGTGPSDPVVSKERPLGFRRVSGQIGETEGEPSPKAAVEAGHANVRHCSVSRVNTGDEGVETVGLGVGSQAPSRWIPLVIDLKAYRVGELHDLLRRVLLDAGHCGLSDAMLPLLRDGSTAGLLVLCDGFDELRPEANLRSTEAHRRTLRGLTNTLCGGVLWSPAALKVVVTTRDNRVAGLGDENAVFGAHRRCVMLPFSEQQIGRYLTRKLGVEESAALPADYLAPLRQSKSLADLSRNPFLLRLFVEALPGLRAKDPSLSAVTRYQVYDTFVERWLVRELQRLPSDGARGEAGDGLLQSVRELCALLAGAMLRCGELTVAFEPVPLPEHASAWEVRDALMRVRLAWAALDHDAARAALRQRFEAADASTRAALVAPLAIPSDDVEAYVAGVIGQRAAVGVVQVGVFQQVCPLRRVGPVLQFLHKSFWEFFVAQLVLQSAGCPAPLATRVARATWALSAPGRSIGAEPEVLQFVADVWQHTFGGGDSAVALAREALFAIVAASTQSTDASTCAAAANAATLLNWVGEPMVRQLWDGVALEGADLTRAILCGTSLRHARLSGCCLERALLTDVDLTGAGVSACLPHAPGCVCCAFCVPSLWCRRVPVPASHPAACVCLSVCCLCAFVLVCVRLAAITPPPPPQTSLV
jgi:hypothetical protein